MVPKILREVDCFGRQKHNVLSHIYYHKKEEEQDRDVKK